MKQLFRKLLSLVKDVFTHPGEVFIRPTENGLYQIIRAGVVGLVCSIADYTLMLVIQHQLGWQAWLCTTLGYLLGTVINYLLGILWIFKKKSQFSRVSEFLIFCVISAIGLGINILVVNLLTVWFALLPLSISRLFAIMIAFFWNYGARKYGLYRTRS